MTAIQDYYIRALEYAESRTTFNLRELVSELGLDSIQEKQLALQIHQNQIFNQNASDYINNYEKDKAKPIDLHFSVEDKFRLLNYVALQEARQSSRSATCFAIIALVISIVSFLVSAYISYIQVNSQINIPSEFIEKINGLSKEQIETNKILSDISHSISSPRVSKEANAQRAK